MSSRVVDMPTLHRSIEAASKEAKELLSRYNVRNAYVVRRERVYGPGWPNVDEPGFEALTDQELPHCPNIVAVVSNHGVKLKG
jgi:hypothetical protein